MRHLPFFLAVLVLQALSGVLADGSRRRRVLASCVAFAALPLPFLMPADIPGLRAMLALGIMMGCLRSIDLARDTKSRTIFFRVQHVTTPFDTRRITRQRPLVNGSEIASVLGHGAIAAGALVALIEIGPGLDPAPRAVARWLAGLVLAYTITDFLYGGISATLRGVGFGIYELHRSPVLSRSVQEFWGERWNRTVSAWFREHLLLPFARRRSPRLGVAASFAASAAFHAYLVLAAIGGRWALVMFAYFAVQAVFVLLELRLRVSAWSLPAARAWTVTLMVLSSPLFVEPGLRSVGL